MDSYRKRSKFIWYSYTPQRSYCVASYLVLYL